MRGGRVRILLALATIGVVGAVGISLGSSGSPAKQERAAWLSALSPSGGTAFVSTTSLNKLSPAQSVSAARGYLVPATRISTRQAVKSDTPRTVPRTS